MANLNGLPENDRIAKILGVKTVAAPSTGPSYEIGALSPMSAPEGGKPFSPTNGRG